MATRTDEVVQKILTELEKSRPWLDRMADIRSVEISVKMNRDTGLPRVVIIRTESEG